DRLTKKQQILVAASAGAGLLLLIVLLIVAFSGGPPPKTPTDSPVSTNTVAPSVDPPERIKLVECLKFEEKNRNTFDAYEQVFKEYDEYIRTTTAAAYVDKAKEAKKAFFDYVEKRAGEE